MTVTVSSGETYTVSSGQIDVGDEILAGDSFFSTPGIEYVYGTTVSATVDELAFLPTGIIHLSAKSLSSPVASRAERLI